MAAGLYAAQWKWQTWQSAAQIAPSALAEPQPVEDAQDSVVQPPNNALGVKEVLSAHLFGQQEEAAKKVVANPAEAPKTQQPLELHGIVFIPHHPEQAIAIIAQVGGVAKSYKTGDALEPLPGWMVLEILPDAVRIGQEEPGEILPLSAMNTTDNAPAAMSPDMSLQNEPAPAPEEGMAPVPEEQPPTQDELLPPDESQVPVQEEAPAAVDPGAEPPPPARTPRVG